MSDCDDMNMLEDDDDPNELAQISDFFEVNVNGSIKKLFYAAFNTMA